MDNLTYEDVNFTFSDQYHEEERLMKVSTLLRNILIPSISVIGLIGNTLSLIVFSARSMKKSASSTFLAGLAFVDNIFLISLFLSWIDGTLVNIFRTDTACEVIMYLTYVSSFLSVWFIVCFTTERFIAINFPLHSHVLCSMYREKLVVAAFSVIALLLYTFPFWTIQVVKSGPRYTCMHRQSLINFLHVTTWVDSCITMVIPFALIIGMNIKVLCKAADFHTKRQQSLAPLQLNTIVKRPKKRTQRYKPQMRVTRTLILVSSTFLVLNLPSHVLRLHNLILVSTYDGIQINITVLYYFIQEIALLLYYSTFSCNFILYTLFGKHFQRSLKAILKCRSTMDHKKRSILQRLSSIKSVKTSL